MKAGIRWPSKPTTIAHERCHGRTSLKAEFSDSLLVAFRPRGQAVEESDFLTKTQAEVEAHFRERIKLLREELKREQYRLKVYQEKFQEDPESDLPKPLQFSLLGLAASTQKSYRGEWRRVDGFFRGEAITDENLPEYLLWRHREKNHAPSSIVAGVRALTWRAKKLGEKSPLGEKSKNVLKHIRRDGIGRGRGKVKALLQADLEKMLQACESDASLWGRRDAALLRLGFDAGLRISEVSAIQADQVDRGPDGKPRLFIQSSKTDQDGVGVYQPVGPEALELVEAWRKVAGITEGPLFRKVTAEGVGETKLTGRGVRDVIKRRAKQAGIKGRVSGHSLRRGLGQQLTLNGLAAHSVAVILRWKSPAMLVGYSEGVEVQGLGISSLYQEGSKQ